jgi:hypothetical protein
MKPPNMNFTGKKLIYRTTVKSILTYGAETWTLKQRHKNKLLSIQRCIITGDDW